MTKVRTRSLLQVVFIGFVLVLMPLCGMIWHNTNALTHLRQLTSDEMERAVKDTRCATLLTAQAIDIERTLRRLLCIATPSPTLSSMAPLMSCSCNLARCRRVRRPKRRWRVTFSTSSIA